MSEEPELSDLEDRLLAFHAWAATGTRKYLARALGAGDQELDAAESRLLEVGFIAPKAGVTRQ